MYLTEVRLYPNQVLCCTFSRSPVEGFCIKFKFVKFGVHICFRVRNGGRVDQLRVQGAHVSLVSASTSIKQKHSELLRAWETNLERSRTMHARYCTPRHRTSALGTCHALRLVNHAPM